MDSAVNLDSNLVLEVVVAELLVDHDLRGVCNEGKVTRGAELENSCYLQRTLTLTLATAGCPTPLAAVQTYSPSVCLSTLARSRDSPELRGKLAWPDLRLQLTRGFGSPWAEHLRV